jgi:uncharacterized ferritin-like protein (DUF455 family)
MNFAPFTVCEIGTRPVKPRSLTMPEGLGDRMRSAAFAEFQAIAAFRWAAETFHDVPQELRDAWTALVPEEIKHYELIVDRMAELGFALDERCVSTRLWDSLKECTSGQEFCIKIAGAEERGRLAGITLCKHLAGKDPRTAAVFQEIVDDEVAHVKLADTFFGWTP